MEYYSMHKGRKSDICYNMDIPEVIMLGELDQMQKNK